MSQKPRPLLVHGGLVGVQLAFASLSIVGKLVLHDLAPSGLAFVRLLGAFAVFAALSRRVDITRIPRRDLLGIAGCACLGIFGNQVLFLHGLRLTTATNATVLVALIPVLTALIAFASGRERATLRAGTGIAIAFGGVVVLVGADALSTDPNLVRGDLLVTANSLAYALYLVLVRGYVTKYGGLPVVTVGFGVGALLAAPFGVPALVAVPHVGVDLALLVGYVVLVPTVFTYLTNAWALRFVDSSIVAIYIYIQPAVAALLAWMFLGEHLTLRWLAAVVMVFMGVLLVTKKPRVKAS